MSAMNTFTFTVAFMLPAKAKKTKNFQELLEYAHSMGFEFLVSSCLNDSELLLRAGKVRCTAQEVADLLIALHLLATQRKHDLIIVGSVNQVKYQHRLFATLSIEKLRLWSQHQTNSLATNGLHEEISRGVAPRKHEDGPSKPIDLPRVGITIPRRSVVDQPRVLH